MASARIVSGRVAGPTLDIVNYVDDDAFWVLRDGDGDATVFEESSPLEYVEVKCSRCGRWTRHMMRDGDGWKCIARCTDA